MTPSFAEIHDLLRLDAESAVGRLTDTIQKQTRYELGRGGVVVAVSGGIDSSLVLALCVQALGKDNVFGLLMPEKESSPLTLELSRIAVDHVGIRSLQEDITPILEACGCYRRRDEAIQSLIPEYCDGYKSKLVNASLLETGTSHRFSIIVESPEGQQIEADAPMEVLARVVAATNFKQRTRKMMEYHFADLYHYAVTGTPNRLEYDLGFFVKNGDGAADLKPIAHLYKSQVYQLARYLELPEAILEQSPSTDTYSLMQTQEEFYFAMPLALLDLCLFCKNNGKSFDETAAVTGLAVDQVKTVFADIVAKRSMGEYLRSSPLFVEKL